MAQDQDDGATIERGSFEDRAPLEKGRPDGLGEVSPDQPVLPSKEKVQIPRDWPRKGRK